MAKIWTIPKNQRLISLGTILFAPPRQLGSGSFSLANLLQRPLLMELAQFIQTEMEQLIEDWKEAAIEIAPHLKGEDRASHKITDT